MISLRILLIFSLLFGPIACSQKKSKPVEKSVAKKETSSKPSVEEKKEVVEKNPEPSAPPIIPTKPETSVPATEKFVDTYISSKIQKLRSDLQAALQRNRKQGIRNVQFANRISRVEFTHGTTSKLKIITHSDDKAYSFEQLSAEGNVQYFNSYNRDYLNGKKEALYAAEVETVKTKNKILSIIKLKHLSTHESVSVIYLKKTGVVTAVYRDGYDYSRELTKTSKALLERTLENPQAIGEFYDIITEEPNSSYASRFDLRISDNFLLRSQPLTSFYETETPVPLSLDYAHFMKMISGGSAAYTSIKEPTYAPFTKRNPMELTALVIDMSLDALEKIKGQKHTLPIQFVVQFR